MKTLCTLVLALVFGALAITDALAVPPLLVICPSPLEAADIAKESVAGVSSLPDDLAGDCKAICAKKYLAACKAAAGAARKCQTTMLGKHLALIQAACKTDPDKDVAKMCKDAVKSQVQSNKENLKNSHALALECCNDNVAPCTSLCQGLGGMLQDCPHP
jgi:hypothetical protein